MDKISKALRKLSDEEKEIVKTILTALKSGRTAGFDVKKLKGRNDIFRIRKGRIRIIYQKEAKTTRILSIERRSDNTYNL